ncbi:MAG: plastocyanin/azurin family copper-binding protein [Balneolales bacterium]
MKLFFYLLLFLFCFSINLAESSGQSPKESDYYIIDPLPIPEDIIIEAGGLVFNEHGQLAVATRRGELWLISDPGSENPIFERFAQGLHEPLGIAYRNGSYFVTQRGELTRIEDRSNNGTADSFKTIYSWPLTGNYHEYSYGPKLLPNGEMLVTLNLSWTGRGSSLIDWRGWMLRITEDGKMIPWATGLRSPLGFGVNEEGDVFYAENQGDWIASGWITHLEEGDFAGHPEGLKWTDLPSSPIGLSIDDVDDSHGLSIQEQAQNIPELKLPAVWLPHGIMGISTSDILLIENDDQVGPFANQLLVGDQGHSKIMRVSLEKVKGKYQGAVFGFREAFSSGVVRLEWGPDNEIFTGMTSRGWSSTGQNSFGIDRLKWNGVIPFEMHSIIAESNGFTINFTKPVDVETASKIKNYQITSFRYKYHRQYGSPIIDRESKIINRFEIAEDLKSVRLYINEMREGYIYEIKTQDIISNTGTGILHPVGYYTMNYLPESEFSIALEKPHEEMATIIDSSKNVLKMPANWNNGADLTIQLGTLPGLRFDMDEITVEAGSKVALTFSNNDDMLHNFVIVQPETADLVGTHAMKLGLEGAELEYIPTSEEVLFHTSLLKPGEVETIYFVVPEETGNYEYVCTFPGHHLNMRGILKVI